MIFGWNLRKKGLVWNSVIESTTEILSDLVAWKNIVRE